MSYMIDQAYHVVMILIFMLMALMIFFFSMYMYTAKRKKRRREADMYFQSLDRKDAKDFLDFEDIVDDMVVTNHHRTFIAAFKCRGFNLSTASSAQIAGALQGYLGFVNTIKSPITYRQYFVPMSLDNTKSMYAARYEELERELFHKTEDREELLNRLNEIRGIDAVHEESLQTDLLKIQSEIANMEWRRMHLEDQMGFMDAMFDSNSIHPSAEEAYLVEWSYNSNDYSIELTEEEIHKKAIQELDNLCSSMIATLRGCNVTAYRCSTQELIEMFYQHTHPLSSAEFKMGDVLNSEYFDEFVTSHDLERKQRAAYHDAMIEEGASIAQTMEQAIIDEINELSGQKERADQNNEEVQEDESEKAGKKN